MGPIASRELNWRLTGSDVSASKALRGVGETGSGVSKKIGGAFTSLGSKIGGEFGEILTKVGEGFDAVGEKGGKGLASKLAAGGAAVAVLGGTMLAIGSKRKQSENQLKAAIEASGHSYDEYESKIKQAIKSQEKFGHTEGDTSAALMKLTNATQDPAKALANMGLVADLAASKHESLAAAADQVAKVYGGSGKVLKAYGITLESSKKDAAALTSATRTHQAAVANLAKAQEGLTHLTEIDAGKTHLSVSSQITLRKAQEAVADAIKKHGANSVQAQKAEQNLADTQARLTDKTHLTVAEQLALKRAQDLVADAQKKLVTSTAALTAAQANNKTGTQTADAALGQLAVRIKGQASAASDTFMGKIKALGSQAADFASAMSQKFGPAVTIIGSSATAAGTAIGFLKDKFAASKAASAEAAAAQASSAAVQEAAAARVVAADAAVAAAAGTTTVAVDAALAEQTAAREAAAAAAVVASEETGAASKLALGPVGIALTGIAFVGGLAAGAYHLFGQRAKEGVKPVQELTSAIMADSDALGANTQKIVEQMLQKKGLYDSGRQLGISLGTLTSAAMGNSAAMAIVTAKLHEARKAGGMTGFAAAKLARDLGIVTGGLQASKHAADNLTQADKQLTGATVMSAHAAGVHLRALGATSAQAQKLYADYMRLPLKKRTAVSLDDYASTKIAAIKQRLQTIPDITRAVNIVTYQTQATNKRIALTGHAGGSDFYEGGTTLVGERGSEVVTLPRGSRIAPHTTHTTNSGQSITININTPQYFGGTTPELARHIVGALEQFAGAGGKMRITKALN